MTLALTTTGLAIDTFEEIRDRIRAAFVAEFGVSVNTEADAFIGQVINIFSEFYAASEGELLKLYASFDPAGASGAALDARAALTGSIRRGETFSTVDGVLTFNAAGTVANGDQFEDTGTGEIWEAINGPYTVAGAGTLAATLQAVNAGPVRAPAGSTWALVTLNPALDSFTNPSDDADLGRFQESDAEFRRRRAIEIYAQGEGSLLAISAVVSRVEGVTAVRTYHNPATSPVDSRGIPFKAFNVVVDTDPSPPGAALQQSIFDAIWTVAGPSGQAYGTGYTGTVTDTEGNTHPIAFDLISETQVYLNVTISTAGTEQAISENIAEVARETCLEYALANWAVIGRDQIAGEFEGLIWQAQANGEISGMTSVQVQLSDTGTGGPYSDPLVIGPRERPAFDSAAIAVTVT